MWMLHMSSTGRTVSLYSQQGFKVDDQDSSHQFKWVQIKMVHFCSSAVVSATKTPKWPVMTVTATDVRISNPDRGRTGGETRWIIKDLHQRCPWVLSIKSSRTYLIFPLLKIGCLTRSYHKFFISFNPIFYERQCLAIQSTWLACYAPHN